MKKHQVLSLTNEGPNTNLVPRAFSLAWKKALGTRLAKYPSLELTINTNEMARVNGLSENGIEHFKDYFIKRKMLRSQTEIHLRNTPTKLHAVLVKIS